MQDVTDLRVYAMRKHPELRDEYWNTRIKRDNRENFTLIALLTGIPVSFIGIVASAIANCESGAIGFSLLFLVTAVIGLAGPIT